MKFFIVNVYRRLEIVKDIGQFNIYRKNTLFLYKKSYLSI